MDWAGRAPARPRARAALAAHAVWTAAYVAMRALRALRALRDPDAFLPTDLGVRHALEQLGEDGGPAAERLAERWRPYRAYAVQHLWARLGTGRAVAREDGAERAPDRLAV